MSLFTGRYRFAHGTPSNTSAEKHPNPGEVALPRILQAHGYETAIAGKIHLNGSGPLGFDRYTMFATDDSGFQPHGR